MTSALRFETEFFLHRKSRWIALGLALAIIIPFFIGLNLYMRIRNPRMLTGDERLYAGQAFAAVAIADKIAERPQDALRDQEFALADLRIAVFRSQAHTKEGYRALTVLEYYMAALKRLPDLDRQCAILRAAPSPTQYLSMGTDALTAATTPFLQCIGRRYEIEGIARSCRNEAQSYLSPTMRPPTDTCVYRWENPSTDRSH
jgi:hypothetical protein